MNNTEASVSSSDRNFIKSSQIFESELKDRLKWTKDKWISSGESGTRINRLCSSLHYWKKKLKPALEKVSLIITLFNRDKDTKISLLDIITAIESLDSSFIVKGIAEFRNPRYVCFYFGSEEIKNKVQESFRLLEDNYVVYMSWALGEDSALLFLKVHWLALTVDLELIKKALGNYVSCVEEERKKIKFMSGREMPSGKMTFRVNLKKDIKPEMIPHVMEIAGLEALITVSGRQALCLNCDTLGHISKNCKFRYCSSCRALMAPGHICSSDSGVFTYAEIVKPRNDEQQRVQSDDWGAEIIINGQENKELTACNLEKKISDLENEIKNNESLISQHSQSSVDGGSILDSNDENNGDSDSVYSLNSQDEKMQFESQKGTSDGTMLVDRNSKKVITTELKKQGIVRKANKKHIAKRKRSVCETPPAIQLASGVLAAGDRALDDPMTLRSYGRPVVNNQRRIKEQLKFDKMMEKSPDNRQFVFKD